jgi:hypothetical protein
MPNSRYVPDSHLLKLAVAGYLARYKALPHHAESDLRAYLGWCADRHLGSLTASRPQVELYVRWTQVIRRLKPSTVSRRTSLVAGFYRTAVIDGLLERECYGRGWPRPTATSRPSTSVVCEGEVVFAFSEEAQPRERQCRASPISAWR